MIRHLPKTLFAAILVTFSLSFAQTIDITLSDHIPGVDYKKNPVLNFQRKGKLLDSQMPITEGKALSEKAASGQKTPTNVILTNAWLTKSGQFDKFRQLLGTSLTKDQKESISDSIMKQMQKLYENFDTIAPIAELQSKDNSGTWVIYRAKGNGKDTVYIDFAKRVGDVYFPAFGGLEDDIEVSNIMNALITEDLKHVTGLITLKQSN